MAQVRQGVYWTAGTAGTHLVTVTDARGVRVAVCQIADECWHDGLIALIDAELARHNAALVEDAEAPRPPLRLL